MLAACSQEEERLGTHMSCNNRCNFFLTHKSNTSTTHMYRRWMRTRKVKVERKIVACRFEQVKKSTNIKEVNMATRTVVFRLPLLQTVLYPYLHTIPATFLTLCPAWCPISSPKRGFLACSRASWGGAGEQKIDIGRGGCEKIKMTRMKKVEEHGWRVRKLEEKEIGWR